MRRGWRQVLGWFVLGIAVAGAIVLWAPKSYRSPASIVVRQSDAGTSLLSKIAGQSGVGDLAGLVAGTALPAMGLQEVRGGGKRRADIVQVAARAVIQHVLGQELGMADLAVGRAPGVRRQETAIDQGQRGVELVGEVFRTAAIVGERRHRGERVDVAADGAEAGLHAPDRQERARRHAVALLDRVEEGRVLLLQSPAPLDDGRAAALGEELVQRQLEAVLAPVRRDGGGRVGRVLQRREAGRAGPAARLLGELPLPRIETGRGVAALRGLHLPGAESDPGDGRDRDGLTPQILDHAKHSFGASSRPVLLGIPGHISSISGREDVEGATLGLLTLKSSRISASATRPQRRGVRSIVNAA